MADAGLKPLFWVASAKRDYAEFPPEVISECGFALYFAQMGDRHPTAKVWKGAGTGVLEVVEDGQGGT